MGSRRYKNLAHMSAPFDPSKLDLDISGNTEDTGKTQSSSQTSSNSWDDDKKAPVVAPKATKKEETVEIIENKQEDILWALEVPSPEKSQKESEEVQKIMETPKQEEQVEKKEVSKKENTQDIVDMIEKSTPKEEKTIQKSHDPVTVETTSAVPETPTKMEKQEEQAENTGKTEEKNNSEAETTQKKLIDINISSLEEIASLIDEKQYDYVLIEPEDMQVKITFKQDNIDRDIKYIKFPTYTTILFSIKQHTKMVVEDSSNSQEWKGEIMRDKVRYKIAAKTAPGQNGERIWLKVKKDTTRKDQKQVKKASLSMVLWFLGAILFVWLVLGGAFIAFIVMNAKTVEDVKFFASLGINLNDINTFISQIVTIIFAILLFLCTAALSVSLFKFFLTKKIYKRKKVVYGLVSTVLLMLTFATWSAWMIIDGKIKNLPNWQEQAYGDLKIFDNSLLISQDFTAQQALLSETENLIGPVTLQFNLENFQTNQSRKGVSIKKYLWNFAGEEIETFTPIITKTFDEKKNYEISVTAIWNDAGGEDIEQVISNIPAISISHVIEIEETLTNNGGKKLSFDATDLQNLWKIDWYFKDAPREDGLEGSYPEWTKIEGGYEFIPGKIFFDEIFVGVSIINNTTVDPSIDKIIVISPDGASDISGEIDFNQDIEDELSFEFFVKNPSTGFANGFIETYKWTIGDKTFSSAGNFGDESVSPSVDYTFANYGEHEIEVELTDSKGKTEILRKTINIQKKVNLKLPLKILDSNNEEIEDVRYEKKSYEYFIDSLWVPAKLTFDARLVRPESILYSLQEVTWDVWDDGNIDGKGKSFAHEIPTEWNHTVVAEYKFVHRKNPDDVILLKEYVFIEWIKKEAILDLQIEKNTNYAPVTVRFDASKSFIKNDDIIKFVYDYGDGFSEERDAINPWHRYTKAGDYTVKLTVIWSTWKSYSIEKKLILLPPPQTVKISTSLKKAPVWQWIDFSSAESEGQIIEYFWDFGDGNVSTQANPTHSYSKPWNYEVSLKVDFSNSNSITDSMEIQIYEE